MHVSCGRHRRTALTKVESLCDINWANECARHGICVGRPLFICARGHDRDSRSGRRKPSADEIGRARQGVNARGLIAPSSARPSRRHQRARRAEAGHTEHNVETGCSAVGHQVRLPGGGAERGLDIERGRFRVCRQHLCDNGGDGADIAGAVGKQHGVTVLEGKRHDARIAPRALTAEQLRRSVPLFASFCISVLRRRCARQNLSHLLARRVDGIFLSDFEQGEIGPNLFRHACLMGLEGVGLLASGERIRGGRFRRWIKVKNRQHPAFSRVMDQF